MNIHLSRTLPSCMHSLPSLMQNSWTFRGLSFLNIVPFFANILPTSDGPSNNTMSFGWSAGDIVSAITLLLKIGAALQDAGGASSEYRDAVGFLKTLQTTLEHLKAFSSTPVEFYKAENLRQQCDHIQAPLKAFLDDVTSKFDAAMGQSCGRKKFLTAPRKIQWALYTSKKIKRLQERIIVPIGAVNMLLGLQTM